MNDRREPAPGVARGERVALGCASATVTELPASHVSMMSHPEVAVEAILATVAATA